jgi:GNAT superfamily N-acetyltransferase
MNTSICLKTELSGDHPGVNGALAAADPSPRYSRWYVAPLSPWMSPIHIRHAHVEEAEVLASIHRTVVPGATEVLYEREHITGWFVTRTSGTSPGPLSAATFVAEQDDELVGFAVLELEQAAIEALCVHPRYARRGIGSLLLATLEEAAADAGLTCIAATATADAVTFYVARGYRSIGPCAMPLRTGALLPGVRLLKDLALEGNRQSGAVARPGLEPGTN